MFRRLFRRRNERAIFEFFDGTAKRRIDPLPAARRLEDRLGDEWPRLLQTLVATLPAAGGVDVSGVLAAHKKAQADAAKRLSDAVCEAFGVKPLGDAGGLTEGERVALAADFLGFMAQLREEAGPFETSPAPTAG